MALKRKDAFQSDSPLTPSKERMNTALLLRPLVATAALALAALAACSSSTTDSCSCNAEVNGDKQTVACGATACVGGTTVTCSSTAAVQTGGSCTTSGSSGTSGTSGGTDDCAALATYCATKCATPASVNAACVDAANAGDQQKCVIWRAVNGSLCKP
ncbi:hypothetical protein BH11MYX4_BH11MYX4_67550 [soil metagenome]